MKIKKILFGVAIFILIFTSACGGGTATPVSAPAEAPTEASVAVETETEVPAEAPTDEVASEGTTEFPLPDDASNLMVIGEGVTNFQTTLSIPDVVTFYRFAFPDYTEREILTVVEEGVFNLVFDGHESGQAIVIQGFPMNGVINVSIRLEDA